MLIGALKRFADLPAIADSDVRWTYRELAQATGRVIAVFRSMGLHKGSAISLLSSNRVEAWAVMCAAMVMGMRYTSLHPMAAENDHVFVVEDAEIDALVVDGAKFAERGRAIRSSAGGLKHFLSLGPVDGAVDLLAALPHVTAAPLVDESEPDETAWLAYTGGTTGRSKGVMIPHRALTSATTTLLADWDWPIRIRFLAATPISHAAGVAIFPVMLRGGFTRLLPTFEIEDYCRVVADEQITATFLVPTMIYSLLDHAAVRARYDLSSLDMIVYGAAPMSPDRLLEGIGAFGPVFVQIYGQAEAPQCLTTLRKIDHDPRHPERLGSCGMASPLVAIKLFNREMREVDIGEPGEICVRGPLVMSGYWKQPEATKEAFRGGWLHTGDVAVKDEDGYFYIVDRTRDMIISGGFNIYPREVEDALMSHAAVASAAAIGVPDDKWGEAVKAFVVLKPGAATNASILQAHVKQNRGAPWSPKSIEFVDAIPLTGLGKIDRKSLRAPYWDGRARGVA